MFVVLIDLELVDGQRDAFLVEAREHAANSLEKEQACHRFDVCADENAENKAIMYQVYLDAASFQKHLETGHFAEFEEAVKPLIAEQSARVFALET